MAPLRTGPLRAGSGFTLMEMIVVILILGVVAYLALPKFGSLLDVQIKSGIRHLVGTIRFAFHESAITKNHLRLNYDIAKDEYWLTAFTLTGEFTPETSTLTSRTKLPDGIHFEDVVTAEDGKVSDKEVFTTFYPNGFVEPTVIHLKDDGDTKFTLRIKPLTGGVEIYDHYVDFVEGQVKP